VIGSTAGLLCFCGCISPGFWGASPKGLRWLTKIHVRPSVTRNNKYNIQDYSSGVIWAVMFFFFNFNSQKGSPYHKTGHKAAQYLTFTQVNKTFYILLYSLWLHSCICNLSEMDYLSSLRRFDWWIKHMWYSFVFLSFFNYSVSCI